MLKVGDCVFVDLPELAGFVSDDANEIANGDATNYYDERVGRTEQPALNQVP